MKEIKVVELFAGVGGFRVGLENIKSKDYKFKTVFASQYEPSRTSQFAYECYKKNFGDDIISNEDIAKVEAKRIPKHDLLVGGFPCQDYSVATTKAKGLEGKKGVLWWEIYRIIEEHDTKYLLLENVDRLLKSPTSQRGRDFAIMLKSLDNLGYNVEWRVINAAEYGFSQKRRRVFIFAYKNKKEITIKEENLKEKIDDIDITIFDNVFPAQINQKKLKDIFSFDFREKKSKWYTGVYETDLQYISDFYNTGQFGNMFRNSGTMINGKVLSFDVVPHYNGENKTLGELVHKEEVSDEYFLTKEQDAKMKINRAGKKIERTSKTGHKYMYTEGSMNYPDPLNLPGRTMLTSEGTINRSSHIVEDYITKKKRFITPIEAERLNGFEDDWTEGMTKRERYFCMGNALVTGVITKIGEEIIKEFKK